MNKISVTYIICINVLSVLIISFYIIPDLQSAVSSEGFIDEHEVLTCEFSNISLKINNEELFQRHYMHNDWCSRLK